MLTIPKYWQVIGTKLNGEALSEIDGFCKKCGKTRSKLVRELLDKWVEEQKNEQQNGRNDLQRGGSGLAKEERWFDERIGGDQEVSEGAPR